MLGLILNVVVTVSCEITRRSFPELCNRHKGDQGGGGISSNTTSDDDATVEEQLLFPDRPSWDIPRLSQFGERVLSPEYVWELMDGVAEPMTNIYWVGLITVLVTFVTPLTVENSPPLLVAGGETGGSSPFLYPPGVINGLPWWVFKLLIIVLIPYMLLLVSIWRMPQSFDGLSSSTTNLDDESSETSFAKGQQKQQDTSPQRTLRGESPTMMESFPPSDQSVAGASLYVDI
jgi:hypothetical protein